MKIRPVATFALVLGLAAGISARGDDKDGKTNAQAPQTIRGTIAGVTLEGELTIDYKTNRAVESDMTMLTVVGTPERGESGDKSAHHHHRHNVYLLWLSQGTKMTDANGKSLQDQKASQAEPWNNIEIGDHVEVEFTPRQLTTIGDHPGRKKHGRHRIEFGDAKCVKILTTPHQQDGSDKGKESEKK